MFFLWVEVSWLFFLFSPNVQYRRFGFWKNMFWSLVRTWCNLDLNKILILKQVGKNIIGWRTASKGPALKTLNISFSQGGETNIPPWKLRYLLKIGGWKMNFAVKMVPFQQTFVNFRVGNTKFFFPEFNPHWQKGILFCLGNFVGGDPTKCRSVRLKYALIIQVNGIIGKFVQIWLLDLQVDRTKVMCSPRIATADWRNPDNCLKGMKPVDKLAWLLGSDFFYHL